MPILPALLIIFIPNSGNKTPEVHCYICLNPNNLYNNFSENYRRRAKIERFHGVCGGVEALRTVELPRRRHAGLRHYTHVLLGLG